MYVRSDLIKKDATEDCSAVPPVAFGLSPAACLGIADSLVLAFLDPSVGIHTTKTNNLYDICQIFQMNFA